VASEMALPAEHKWTRYFPGIEPTRKVCRQRRCTKNKFRS